LFEDDEGVTRIVKLPVAGTTITKPKQRGATSYLSIDQPPRPFIAQFRGHFNVNSKGSIE
jgi:hypothetical protein